MGEKKRASTAWIVILCALGAAVMVLAGYLVAMRTGLFRKAEGIGPLSPLVKVAVRGEQARIHAAQAQISMFETALETFEVDCGRFPTPGEGLGALVKQPANCPNWNKEGYLQEVPSDPWGRPYVYLCPGQHNTKKFDLLSLGPDGQQGTEDDIGNWKN